MKTILDYVLKNFALINNGDTNMHSDEELIADNNIRIVAQVLIDTINVLCNVYGCENSYIRDLVNCGNGI